MKGIIALDIDGTIAVPGKTVSEEVIAYLSKLQKEGWTFLFITGRPFQLGHRALQHLRFPYYYAVQNGAITLEMPSYHIFNKKYLDRSVLPAMQKVCEGEASDFAVYAGFGSDLKHQDLCYYRPDYFSADFLKFLKQRMETSKEVWLELNTFDDLPLEEFAAVKCFATDSEGLDIPQRIENELGLHVPMIKDPFNSKYYVIQATHPEASKGEALRSLKEALAHEGVIIAAGDDNNDRTMLAQADIKIVMASAPQDMHLMADIVAPSAEHNGIITGLNEALRRV